jgi:two-component system sensor kinase FixL
VIRSETRGNCIENLGLALGKQKLNATFDRLQAAIVGLVSGAARNGSNDRSVPKGRLGDVSRLLADLKRQCGSFADQGEELSRLASIVSCSDDAILSKDLKGIVQSWNKSAERLFGYTHLEMVGQSIRILIPPDRIKEEAMILRRLRQGRPINHYETVRRHKDGTLIDVSISLSPIRDAAGKIRGAAKIVRDISERKASEAALLEGDRRMVAIVRTAVDAIITIDERGIIESSNPATERLFCYSVAELLGQNVKMLMPEPFQREHDGYLRAYLNTGHAKIIGIGREVTAMRKDGTTFPIHLSVSEVPLGKKRLFTGMIHDLSSRRQLERQISEASAHEQRRIGQDLHDGLCQDLIGIALGADMAARQLASRGAAEAEAVERLAASVREAAGQARRLSHGLNPVDLHAGGLPVALQALAAKIAESFRVDCHFEWDEQAEVKDNTTATHLYRISQEAVSNAIKHGKAQNVRISLREAGDKILLTVEDDGIGLPSAMIGAPRPPHDDRVTSSAGGPALGIGLRGMRYRANLMGGVFEVAPGRSGGTLVTCLVPNPQPKANAPRQRAAPRSRGQRSVQRISRP